MKLLFKTHLKKISFVILFTITIIFADSKYTAVENSDKLAVLIHGIADKPYVMWRMEKTLQEAGYSVLNFDYASTQWTMDSTVAALKTKINEYEPHYDKIYFVVHSLGTFVVRSYLSENFNEKFKSIVMIAPPNKGSILAERFNDLKIYEWILGEAGKKLGKDHDDYWRKYPTPNITFGIIAGGMGTKYGFNPLVPGDDDGVVGVDETKIAGYEDFIIVPGIHSTLLWQSEVVDQVLYFLTHQKFLHQ